METDPNYNCVNCFAETLNQYTEEITPSQNYQELLQQYIMVSSHNEELAKAYLILEQKYASSHVSYTHEKELEEELLSTQAQLTEVMTSLSWRVTAPMRKLMAWFRRRI